MKKSAFVSDSDRDEDEVTELRLAELQRSAEILNNLPAGVELPPEQETYFREPIPVLYSVPKPSYKIAPQNRDVEDPIEVEDNLPEDNNEIR